MSKLITLSKLKTALTPLIALINKKAERPNWNENNYDSVSYIENRPFYSKIKELTINVLSETACEYNSEGVALDINCPLIQGQVYTVTWNGIPYECKARNYDGYLMLGNNAVYEYDGGNETDTGEPFAMETNGDETGLYIYIRDEEDFTISISYKQIKEEVVKIPKKYLPELNTIGMESLGEGAEIFNDYKNNHAEGDYAHAEGESSSASGYASHAEGVSTWTNGMAAHAEGQNTTAYGDVSHAEGRGTYAENSQTHAEGYGTKATGENSHAEGYFTHADGISSHAEGSSTYATGDHSHAEGSTSRAIGTSAHAEGHSMAVGTQSHAEGATYSVGTRTHSEGNNYSETITINSIPSFPNDYLTPYHSMKPGMVIYRQSYSWGNKTASAIYAVITKVISEDGQKRITTNVPLFHNYSDGTVESELSNQSVELIYYGAATGANAHSEGTSTAYGNYSHSEGYKTLAIGNYSHSEGENTVAASTHQHVQGRYNVEDNNTTYLHIVGNGNHSPTIGTTYSNAHTLDWDGNAWFSGDVYVGSTYGRNRDDGSKKLATEEFVETQLSSFAPIQIVTWGAND